MAINPVFLNELRQSAFRRRGTLVIIALTTAGVLFSLLAQADAFRQAVAYAPLVLLPLLVPAIASGAFAKEYEQQTWLDLTLTRLSNAQVVWGKFGAYFVQVAASLFALIPSLLLMLLAGYSRRLSDLRFEVVPVEWQAAAVVTTLAFMFKLLLSACFYILLTMICSRYSPNRRVALTWSYIAMALYTAFGVLTWTLVGSLDYQNQVADQSQLEARQSFVPIDLTVPGFMERFHLIFCAILGIGSFILLWISLSEQRGYRGSIDGSITRGWQPIARAKRNQTT